MAITSARGISLANKCQLLFGLAVLLILTAALSAPWFRMQRMVDEKEFDLARQLADAWLAGEINSPSTSDGDLHTVDGDDLGIGDGDHGAGLGEDIEVAPGDAGDRDQLANSDPAATSDDRDDDDTNGARDARVRADSRPSILIKAHAAADLDLAMSETPAAERSFAAEALMWFRERPEETAYQTTERGDDAPIRYLYARPLLGESLWVIRAAAQSELTDEEAARESATPATPEDASGEHATAPDGLWGVLTVDRVAAAAMSQIYINRIYIVLAGLMAGALAILVFYFITTRLILSPVRVLRETAERASQGDLYVRSDISTGDEFEELSDTFNLMLANLKQSQDQLRMVNKGLDLKLNELAESNVSLMEASRLKSEFLANVSHELRTPLNSIIGFAEVIRDLKENATDSAEGEKRRRFAENIRVSGKSLLDLINDLLDLAKIEAGRIDIEPEPTSVADVCEGLASLIRPQAEKKGIALEVRIAPSTPVIETDPARFEQIIFNFLSNAVKFTPAGGHVRLTAERAWSREHGEMMRLAVSDTGPGIAPDDQRIIFEKFRQVDSGHARKFQGTGLGLSICRELSRLLGGQILVESEPGHGATFILLLPVKMTPAAPQALMPINPAAH